MVCRANTKLIIFFACSTDIHVVPILRFTSVGFRYTFLEKNKNGDALLVQQIYLPNAETCPMSLQNDNKHKKLLTKADATTMLCTSIACATSIYAVVVSFCCPSHSSCPSSHIATRIANFPQDRDTTCPATLRNEWIQHAVRRWCELNK